MTAPPYMPLFVGDYLTDTDHLTTVEHGAYLLLIMNYWQRGKPLCDDDKRLAAAARMTIDEWQNIRDEIQTFFVIEDDEKKLWRHARIDHELEIIRAKSAKAKASANSRWNKGNNASAKRPQSKRNATILNDIDKRVFVAVGTKEWEAWKTVKTSPTTVVDGRQGWHFPTLMPEPKDGKAAS